jgi:heptosyltransferase-1
MGDILHALPAITALRKAHPTWRIGWAVDPRWVPLLSCETPSLEIDRPRSPLRPLVDHIHLVPSKAWGKRPFHRSTRQEFLDFRAELHAAEYDAVLDLQGAIRSAVVSRLSGCRRIIGEAHPRENVARWLFTERVETVGKHVIEQDVELACAVAGDLLNPTSPWLPTNAAAEDWCDELKLLQRAIFLGKPVVLIHPGAGWGAKRWPAERYGAITEEFANRGALVLINAGPGEESLAASVVAAANGRGTVVVSTIDQLIALTRRVTLVIGGDTGPVHLACALGRPVVGVYGPTDPSRNGPYGTRVRVLRNPDSRRDHTRREVTEAGLLTIAPEQVVAAAIELMIEERRIRTADPVGPRPVTSAAPQMGARQDVKPLIELESSYGSEADSNDESGWASA